MPGEAEKVAEYLKMPVKDLFSQKLGIDWFEEWEGADQEVFVLAPAITSMETGEEYPGNPQGRCVFLTNGLCDIHPVKPYECFKYDCKDANDNDFLMERKKKITEAWYKNQEQIKKLLGREPVAKEYGLLDWLF